MSDTECETGTYDDILYDVEGAVGVITLNRPDRMNAWTQVMGAEICDALARAEEDDTVRAVVLTGAGERAFCAGADLQGGAKTFGKDELAVRGPKLNRKGKWPNEIAKPVIAAINGHAVGVGITLPMMCDIRFVDEAAKLQFAFVKRGIVPELGSPVTLQKVVGFQRAADLMLTGRMFSGAQAAEYGMALEALPKAQVLPAAMEYARGFADAAPVSVGITKQLLWEGIDSDMDLTRSKETELLVWIGDKADSKEGVVSFVEKRPPNWTMSAGSDMPERD
jgi:enoyl-CoA hydratase/carnithine racemase